MSKVSLRTTAGPLMFVSTPRSISLSFPRKSDLAFQLQTGNISRYAYDLLKLQHLYSKHEIESAILAVPTKTAASKIGSNIANVERIWNEINIFDRFITLPIMLIAFE